MLNIVIPMAGEGSRFKEKGYLEPKPMIDVNSKKMIELVVNNIRPDREHRFIFICKEKHIVEYKLKELLEKISPDCVIIPIEGTTNGAAETVLVSKNYINDDNELMIANCDQWIDIDINDYLEVIDSKKIDGMVMSMTAEDQKWSFLKLDKQNNVVEVREKEVISNQATVGIYNFKKGSDFCSAATKMIEKNDKTMGEFYVAPVYNYLIKDQLAVISHYNIGQEFSGMYGLGTPDDLKRFLKSHILNKATDF